MKPQSEGSSLRTPAHGSPTLSKEQGKENKREVQETTLSPHAQVQGGRVQGEGIRAEAAQASFLPGQRKAVDKAWVLAHEANATPELSAQGQEAAPGDEAGARAAAARHRQAGQPDGYSLCQFPHDPAIATRADRGKFCIPVTFCTVSFLCQACPNVAPCQAHKGKGWRSAVLPSSQESQALALINPCLESASWPKPRGRTACVWDSKDPDMI